MSYKVLIGFTELRRDYLKGSEQSFGEWTEDVQAQLIPGLISSGKIEEIAVSEPETVTEIPATILDHETAEKLLAESQAYLNSHPE